MTIWAVLVPAMTSSAVYCLLRLFHHVQSLMHLSAHALVLQVVYWKARLAVNHMEALPAVEPLMLMYSHVVHDLVLWGFASQASQAALLHSQLYLQQSVKCKA